MHLPDLPAARVGVGRGVGEQLPRAWVGAVPQIPLKKVGLKQSPQVLGQCLTPPHTPHQPRLGLYMNHPAQSLPGGPGQAGSSSGCSATPAAPPQAQGGAGLCPLRARGLERGREGDVICSGQWSGVAILHLSSSPPSGSSLHQLSPTAISSQPQAGRSSRRAGGTVARPPSGDSRLLSAARPSSSSHFALSSPWASSPRGSLQLQLFRS